MRTDENTLWRLTNRVIHTYVIGIRAFVNAFQVKCGPNDEMTKSNFWVEKEIFSKKGNWKIRLAKFQRNDLWSPKTQDQVSAHADVQCLAICFIWENDFPLLPGVGDGVALCTHTCGLLLISDGTAACNGKINRLAYHAFYREHLPSLSLLYYKSAGCLFFQTRCVRHDRMDSLRICPTFSSSFFLPFSFFFA